MELTVWAFFGPASFALTAASFYVRDILVLRALSICAGAVGYLAWPRQELRKLLKRNPTMDIAMNSVFSVDLTNKLGGAPA